MGIEDVVGGETDVQVEGRKQRIAEELGLLRPAEVQEKGKEKLSLNDQHSDWEKPYPICTPICTPLL